ncbi:MAG TPA: nitrile hydratase subunit alpha [Chloroflexota bacterium]|nr:nitrile hydratase subunit alpha [Chloroflexota bacterium]
MAHMHDFEAHVRAVEEDLEYYRTKRFEPRIFFLIRRGVISFHDLLGAFHPSPERLPAEGDFEPRIRSLEDQLDEYVRGIGLASSGEQVIEDMRKERGDYDSWFRMAKRHHDGSLEERVAALEAELQEQMAVLRAFTTALIQTGHLTETELEYRRERSKAGPWNGAKIVARAWVDPEFKRRLLELGREAVRELDIPPGRLGKLGVAPDTDGVHNVVVCTLCSCYPHDLLGDTPWWYKHDSYKQRVVRDPRGTLREMFGLELPNEVEIHVHDSTSDIRWMVLPQRPPGTEGLTEDRLAQLITQECLIGTALPGVPATVHA